MLVRFPDLACLAAFNALCVLSLRLVIASCVNLGCQKDFVVADNDGDSCRYHRLNPVFHDGGKHWGCCPDQVRMYSIIVCHV